MSKKTGLAKNTEKGEGREVKREAFKTLLKCALTEKEMLAYAKEMAEISGEITAIEEDMKAVAQEFKSRLAGKSARFSAIGQRVQNGAEFREIDCVREFDYSAGLVTEIRRDTCDKLNTRAMTDDEKQGELGL